MTRPALLLVPVLCGAAGLAIGWTVAGPRADPMRATSSSIPARGELADMSGAVNSPPGRETGSLKDLEAACLAAQRIEADPVKALTKGETAVDALLILAGGRSPEELHALADTLTPLLASGDCSWSAFSQACARLGFPEILTDMIRRESSRIPEDKEVEGAMLTLIRERLVSDPEGALAEFEAFRTAPGKDPASFAFRTELSRLVNRWAEESPAAAAAWVTRHRVPDDMASRQIEAGVLKHWWKVAPAAAFAWWEMDIRDEWTLQLVAGQSDASVVSDMVTRIPESIRSASLIEILAQKFLDEGRIDDLDTVCASGKLTSLEVSIIRRIRDAAPATPALLADTRIGELLITAPESVPDEQLRAAAARLVQDDPDTVAKWIGELPAGGLRDAITETAARSLEALQPGASEAWLESFPRSPQR